MLGDITAVARIVVFVSLIIAVVLCLGPCSCVFVVAEPRQVDGPAKRIWTANTVKAHLYDGSVVVFPHGAQTRGNTLRGDGIRYDLLRQNSWQVRGVERDSVALVESYVGRTLPIPTILSLMGLAGSCLIAFALMMASVDTKR